MKHIPIRLTWIYLSTTSMNMSNIEYVSDRREYADFISSGFPRLLKSGLFKGGRWSLTQEKIYLTYISLIRRMQSVYTLFNTGRVLKYDSWWIKRHILKQDDGVDERLIEVFSPNIQEDDLADKEGYLMRPTLLVRTRWSIRAPSTIYCRWFQVAERCERARTKANRLPQ